MHDIYGIYGFGSFFRSPVFNDIDILVVAEPNVSSPLELYYQVKRSLQKVSKELNVEIDITFLLHSEFQGRPLIEMDTLYQISGAET